MVKPSAHASHILVKSKGEATQLSSNIKKLKDFQKIARKKSDCPSKQKGGDLGWFRKGQMVREIRRSSLVNSTQNSLRPCENPIWLSLDLGS